MNLHEEMCISTICDYDDDDGDDNDSDEEH